MLEPPYWKDYTYGKNKFKRNRVHMLEYQNERLNTRMYLNSIRSQTLTLDPKTQSHKEKRKTSISVWNKTDSRELDTQS